MKLEHYQRIRILWTPGIPGQSVANGTDMANWTLETGRQFFLLSWIHYQATIRTPQIVVF